jgi:hypothetical protein
MEGHSTSLRRLFAPSAILKGILSVIGMLRQLIKNRYATSASTWPQTLVDDDLPLIFQFAETPESDGQHQSPDSRVSISHRMFKV